MYRICVYVSYMCICVIYVFIYHIFVFHTYLNWKNTKYVYILGNTIHFTSFYFQYWFYWFEFEICVSILKYRITSKITIISVFLTWKLHISLVKSTPFFSFRNLGDIQFWNCGWIHSDVSSWTGLWGRRVSKICANLKTNWNSYHF